MQEFQHKSRVELFCTEAILRLLESMEGNSRLRVGKAARGESRADSSLTPIAKGEMKMQPGKRGRLALAVIAGLLLIAVTVLAAFEVVPGTHGSTSAAQITECPGKCAGCPLKGTDKCPIVKRGAEAEASATVIDECCSGCEK